MVRMTDKPAKNIKLSSSKSSLKLGLIANEFYDISLGRMGGFGVAIRQVADFFNQAQIGVEPVFITCGIPENEDGAEVMAHGTRLLILPEDKSKRTQQLRKEKFDIVLTMDYRYNYRPILESLPKVPVIIWVHDPRTPYDMKRIEGTRIPGQGDNVPQGLKPVNCTSLGKIVEKSKSPFSKRPIVFAQPAAYYEEKVVGTYGVHTPPEMTLLPNIIEHIIEEPEAIVKSERPKVVFLARLDPYKRPWLFAELATHFPDVEFIFMGKNHFEGLGAWEPESLPDNVTMMGHIDGEEKVRILSSAWVLINTSIHEGLAISFLEALMCGTPILSCVDSENVVSRYGVYVGRWDGSGREAMPKFIDGLKRLLESEELRTRLAKEGRDWVKENHCKSKFLEAFKSLCSKAGVAIPSP